MIHLKPAKKSDAAFLASLEASVMRAHARALGPLSRDRDFGL
jgi:hypothetical protein